MPDIEKWQGALPGKRNVSDQTSISRSSCGLTELRLLLLASRREQNGRRLPSPAGFLGMVCDSACVKQARSAAQRSRLRSTHHSSRYFHPTLPPSERKPAAYNRTERPSGQESPRTSKPRSTSSLRKATRPAGTASDGISAANGAELRHARSPACSPVQSVSIPPRIPAEGPERPDRMPDGLRSPTARRLHEERRGQSYPA